jgi:hypothetical protein
MSSFSLASLFSKNRFSQFFSKGREHEDIQKQQILKNAQGVDQSELDRSSFFSNDYMSDPQSTITYLGTSFEQYLGNKVSRILKYREMQNYPLIGESIENICDEAIVDNPTGDVMSLHITEEIPEHIDEQLREEWHYLLHDVFQVNERSWDFFKKFMIDGELYIELILDSTGKNIIGIKILPSHTMMPVFEAGEIVSYIQTKKGINNSTGINSNNEQEETVTVFDKSQVVYINYGNVGDNALDVRGYLDSAIRVYNQLKILEDSLVVYRLCLDSESRVRTSNGYKYIKDIEIGEIVYTYSTDGKTERTEVTNKWNNGKKQTVKIRSRHNEIICTLDHPILVKDVETGKIDYVEAGELEVKKHQLVNASKNIVEDEVKVKIPRIIGEEVACLSEEGKKQFKNIKIKRTDYFKAGGGKKEILKEIYNELIKNRNYKGSYRNIKNFFYNKKYYLSIDLAEICCEKMGLDKSVLYKKNKYEFNSERINLPEYIDEDFARLFGFLLGDGCIGKHSVQFAEGEHEDVNKRYSELLTKYFGRCTRQNHKNKKYTGYIVNSIFAADLFKNLGYIKGCKKKRIPEWAFSASKSIRQALVEGFSDADGCERKTKAGNWYSVISIVNKKLIEDIKELWSSIGLSSGKIVHRFLKEYYCKSIGATFCASECWYLEISKFPLDDYENVIEIEQIGEREVFDIEVKSNNQNFIVNNTIVHNCRAPMRRIWNIFTNNMPQGKAIEYIKGLQQKYKKKIVYNSETGATDSTANIMALTEDYWFSTNGEGQGSTVTTLEGTSTFLQDLDDLKWIRESLYKALKIPNSRWSDPTSQTYNVGHSSEITREEVKFTKFVERLQRRFKFLFLDAFITQLRLKGFDQTYTTLRLYDVQFTKSNLFKEYRELEMTNTKLTTLTTAKDLIYSEENPSGIFALEYVMKNMVLMSDEQWNENKEMLDSLKGNKKIEKKEKVEPKEETTPTETPTTTPEANTGGAETTPETEEVAAPTQEQEIAQAVESIPAESRTMKGAILSEWFKRYKQTSS